MVNNWGKKIELIFVRHENPIFDRLCTDLPILLPTKLYGKTFLRPIASPDFRSK